MILRSPIGNLISIRTTERGKIRIYLRHGWEAVTLNPEMLESLIETIKKASYGFVDFEKSIRRFKEAIGELDE